MENFFNWISKPVPTEDVNIWFSINNIIDEKSELFYDFCVSLIILMRDTYLGDNTDHSETNVTLSEEDMINHFNWCWNKTIETFGKENIQFEKDGEHYLYFSSFFMEIFYKQKDVKIKNSIEDFINDLFDKDVTFTKSDLDLYTELYKLLDKNMSH